MQENLSTLSDIQLDAQCLQCVKDERESTERVIRHLVEIESRRFYAVLGYASMFEYATRRLGYTSSAAARRIRVARAQAQLPEIDGALEKGEVSLSSVEICADLLVRPNGAKVLEEIKGKSYKEVERIACMHLPAHPKDLRDQIKLIAVAPSPSEKPSESCGSPDAVALCFSQELTEDLFRVRFTAKASIKDKLKYVQDLMFNGSKESAALETVFENLLDEYIERHCPKAREERRLARQQKAIASAEIAPESPSSSDAQPEQTPTDVGEVKKIPGPISNRGFSSPSPQRSFDSSLHKRGVPIWLRDKVLARDNYQCVYEGPSGNRCTCKANLEIDHVIPFARGGETKLENLRTLCQAHNFHAEIQVFGKEFVESRLAL